MSIFVEDRITGAKLRSMAPIAQQTFQPSDVILILNDEMMLKLVSDIKTSREDFFLSTKSVAIQAGVDHYPIPSRAIGNAFTALFYVDPSGAKLKLDRVEASSLSTYASTGAPEAFYIEGDEIVLLPGPAVAQGTLMFLYERKPNRLVATSSCAKITAIDSSVPGFTTFTVDTDLSTALALGAKVDILSTKSPYLLWAEDSVTTGVSASQIQVATGDVANAAGTVEPQIGDYICPAGFANVPMVPEEFHPVLDQMAAVRLLAALGDLNKWNAAKAELKEVRDEALALVKNRVQSSPTRVSARNGLLSAFQR